jgi:excisionase family DNA binding protein
MPHEYLKVGCARSDVALGRARDMAVSGHLGSLTGMNGTEPTSAAVVESILAEGPLLCPQEAAALLSVKPSWVYESVRAHRIPCLRVGRHIRFTRAMLEQWLAEHVDG